MTVNKSMEMNGNAIIMIQDFITDYGIELEDGTKVFNAIVNYFNAGTLHTIASEIQIITLPDAMACYVMAFLNETYEMPEMYSTSEFYFLYNEGGALMISPDKKNKPFMVSIIPAGKTNQIPSQSR